MERLRVVVEVLQAESRLVAVRSLAAQVHFSKEAQFTVE